MKYLLIVLLFSLYVNFTPRDAYAENILVLGDSLSAAHNIPLESGWVNLLRLKLDAEPNNQWKVINASISGETSTGGLARLPALVEEYKPGLCIVELGANDGLRGQPVPQLKNNLGKIIELCEGKVVLLEIWLPPNYGKQYLDMFKVIYPELAEQYHIPLVPFFLQGVADIPGLMQEDGLHPTAEGQPIILENLWPAISRALQP